MGTWGEAGDRDGDLGSRDDCRNQHAAFSNVYDGAIARWMTEAEPKRAQLKLLPQI